MADYRYAQISRQLNLGGTTQEEQVDALIRCGKLNEESKYAIEHQGVRNKRKRVYGKNPKLAERAFEDQCTTSNPRYPLVSELEEIYKKAYYGTI